MNTELMNEDVVEVVEDITPRSGGSLKGVGIGLVIAGLTYGGIKLVKKIRDKRGTITLSPRPPKQEEEEVTEIVEVQIDKKSKK